jgi:hypothetical protein
VNSLDRPAPGGLGWALAIRWGSLIACRTSLDVVAVPARSDAAPSDLDPKTAEAPARRVSPVSLALALTLALAQAALLARTAWDKSDTVDEPVYLTAAVSQWVARDFSTNFESPALPKWAFALALRLVDPGLFEVNGPHPLWSRSTPELRRNLFLARLTTIAVTSLGGLVLWSAARRFGEPAAAVTLALWCFSPTVLAAGSLATLDAWAASLCAALLLCAVRFVEKPGPRRAAVAGGVLGLGAACKVTVLGLLPLMFVGGALLLARRARVTGRSWTGEALRSGLALGAACVFVLWAVYGFTIGYVDLASSGAPAREVGPLPFPAWINGLHQQWLHGQGGHLNYLFGEVRFTGWWWFYLAALAFKTTLGAQALAGLRLFSWIRSPPGRERLRVDAALLAWPALLLVALSLGRTQNGIKYLLPAFPFAMAWAGRGLDDAVRAFGHWGGRAVVAFVVLGAAESLRVHPHHLMFFNAWAGGPEGGPRYLVHGDDWGQDQRRLVEAQKSGRLLPLYYTRYTGEPTKWGLVYEPPSCEPRPGWYALHAVEVHRPKRVEPGCLDWLTVEPPDARIGYSIYLYKVDRARIERLRAERATRTPFWRSGPPAAGPR